MSRIISICLFLITPMRSIGSPAGPPCVAKKIITITVNPNGLIYMGPDTIGTNQLAAKLHERLWRKYLGNDRMYDEIQVTVSGEVLMTVQGAVTEAIQLAQKNALRDICLQKFKKLYDNIDSGQQKKLQRQFPILFQEVHFLIREGKS